MNKVCLILPCNLYVVPYFKVYENMFTEMGLSYDIITWNRSLIDEKCNGKIISYNVKDVANNRDPQKAFKYIGFYKFVKKHIKKNCYEKIVFLDTSACTLVLLGGYLRRKFAGKYWVDIRDYSFENISIYKKLLGRALEKSYCCDVSSRGFFEFLPEIKNYCVTHNVDYDTINQLIDLPNISSDALRISFIGNVRYYDLNKKLLDTFKNDNRFIIQFFGTGSEVLKDYCENNDIRNVEFEGRFPFERTPEFYQKTDLINNIYGNETMEVKTALSNKLYYSMYLDKPILVSPNTYMSEVVSKYGFGFEIDYSSDNIPDKLYNWYLEYQKQKGSKRSEIIRIVEQELNDYRMKFMEFITK